MSRSVEITTPILSAEHIAEQLGITGDHRKMLFDLADGKVDSPRRKSAHSEARKPAPARRRRSN